MNRRQFLKTTVLSAAATRLVPEAFGRQAAESRVRVGVLGSGARAQGLMKEALELPGVEFAELADAQICCGSAGTYNLDQPEIAASLGEKKARAIIATGADVLASGNIGCLTQLRAHLRRLGSPIRVRHTMQVLRDAYAALL